MLFLHNISFSLSIFVYKLVSKIYFMNIYKTFLICKRLNTKVIFNMTLIYFGFHIKYDTELFLGFSFRCRLNLFAISKYYLTCFILFIKFIISHFIKNSCIGKTKIHMTCHAVQCGKPKEILVLFFSMS